MTRFAFLLLLLSCSPQQATSEPLNVVLIVADDLGIGDLGFLGGEMNTPRLDRLANQSLRFDRFYSWALCSPARAAIITGEDPMVMNMAWNPLRPADQRGLPKDIPTVAERLRAAGYATACIGKWHLGHANATMHPNARGFDYFYGCLQGAIDYQTHLDRNQQLDWQRNGNSLEEDGYATQLIGAEAAHWVRQRGKQSEPFFLYLTFTAPHLPLAAPVDSIRRYRHVKNPARRVYCAMVDELDRAVGQVIDALRQTEQDRKTVVIFLSDNGAGKEDGGSNGGLRGAKGSAFEGGIRVPAFVFWPEKTAGDISSIPASVNDITPTILAAAGLDGSDLGGKSLLALPSDARSFRFAARNDTWTNYALVDGDFKFVRRVRNDGGLVRERLFNLAQDPLEKADMAAENNERVVRYRELLTSWAD